MGVSNLVAAWTTVQLSLLGIHPDRGLLSGTSVPSRQGGMTFKIGGASSPGPPKECRLE